MEKKEKQLPLINSARLTKENYSPGLGDCCPNCNYIVLDEDGLPKGFVPLGEQKLVGYAEPPWNNSINNDCAGVFECKSCGGIYWYHTSKRYLDLVWRNQNFPEDM